MALNYGHDGWAEIDICVEGKDTRLVNRAVRELETDIGLLRVNLPGCPRNEVQMELPRMEKSNGVRRTRIPLRCRTCPDRRTRLWVDVG